MSAFDNLKLAMIPSAYKGAADANNAGGYLGKVYSVLPEQTISDNLVTNGTFDIDASWSLSVTADISGGVLTFTGNSSNVYALQTMYPASQYNGKTLEIKYEIISNTLIGSGFLRAGAFSGASISSIPINLDSSVGVHTFYVDLTHTGNRNVLDLYITTGYTSGSIVIDNVSVKAITDGDFDFSRGSDATRVNSQGYIESIQVLSDNLVTNGDFEQVGSELVVNGDFSTSDLSSFLYTNALLSVISGELEVDITGSGGNVRSNISIAANKIYKVSFSVKSGTYPSTLIVTFAGNNLIESFDPPDELTNYTFYVKSLSTNQLQFIRATGDIGTFYLDNVSVKEVGQGWTFGTNTSVDNGKVVINNPPTAINAVSQTNVLIVGRLYRISFEISDYQSGDIRLNNSFSTNTVFNQNGAYTVDAVANLTGTLNIFASSGTQASLDNISVVEITDDTDIPRIDYTNAACPSLLLEPTRSNLITYSENFTVSPWATNVAARVPNSLVSPDNSNNSYTIYRTSTGFYSLRYSFNWAINTTYTLSCFAKKQNQDFFTLRHLSATNGRVWFDIQNGEVGTIESDVTSANIQYYKNGWYRCSITFTTPSTISNNLIDLFSSGTDNATDGIAGDGVHIYGAQLELGSYPTSYIPTNGTTVTRIADVCHNAGDSTVFNDAEGVFYAEVKKIGNEGNYRAISLSDGTVNNVVRFYYSPIQDRINVEVKSNGVFSLNTFKDFPNKTEHIKLAIKYKSGDLSFWADGIKLSTSASTSMPIGLRVIGFNDGSASSTFQGDTRGLLYFNTALSDAELEALTSSDITRVLKNYARRGVLLDATYEADYVQSRLNKLF